MKGNPQIINALNQLLACELAAMDQYFIHSQMYADMGLSKLHARISHEFDDEKGHATLLIDRILLLEGKPDVTKRAQVRVGDNVREMLEFDLKLEYEVQALLKQTIGLCERQQDFITRKILIQLLEDTEEDHADWLQQQLDQIDLIGLPNYIQSQL